MKNISGKEFAQILLRNGWELRRISGSHHIFTKTGSPARITVPVHGNESLKMGLLRHLMKLAGLDKL